MKRKLQPAWIFPITFKYRIDGFRIGIVVLVFLGYNLDKQKPNAQTGQNIYMEGIMSKTSKYNLIVVGGGTSGILCALAAARSGLKTAIIEKNTYLGGMACGSGLTEMNAAGFQSKPLYRGIEQEIFDALIASGHAEYHFAVPMSSNKDVKVDRLRYDPEMLKIIFEQKAVDAGIDLYYETELERACEREAECEVTVRTLYETFTLHSDYLADATGNANVIRALGGETIKTPEEQQLTATLMFRLSNVDMDKLKQYQESGKIPDLIREGFEQGILKGKILAFTPIPGSRDVSLNVTRAQGDYEDAGAYTRSIVDARKQILSVFAFVKEKVPGMEQAYVSNIAPVMGVRDGRRAECSYTLKLEDLENMTDFADSIACGCYPMDIHDPVTKSVIWKVLPGVYHIPYRSLVPKKLHRTLVLGKSLCAEKKVTAAIRVMPIMMNVGESAGYLFALAQKDHSDLDTLKAEEIRACLSAHYGA